jgi:putative ABC transport system permease protein
MALGAQRKQVLSLILRQTIRVLTAGLVVGVPAVLATQRLISTQLYGLPPIDPISISIASVLLIAAAILAGYLPARQATKVDPMEALRYE